MTAIRIALPTHLRTLASVEADVIVDVGGEVTIRSVLNALETAHPALAGTIRDQATGERRKFMRYFADGQDLSLLDPDKPLPPIVTSGEAPLRLVGAIAGG